MGERETLTWAIAGCGVIGAQHAAAVAQVPGCALVACVDSRPEAARTLAAQYGMARWYSSLEEMLREVGPDVMSVCTPSGLHEAICVQSAQSGCHLLVEKPIEIRLEAADRIIDACSRAGVKLGVAFQRRMAHIPQATRRAVQAGLLGELIAGDAHVKYHRPQAYYDGAGWRGTWALDGGGALMNQGVHTVDLLQWIMGPVQSVYAYGGTLAHRCEVEDTIVAAVKFANGALGVLQAMTSCFPAYGHRLEFHGRQGTIMVHGDMRAGDRIVHAGVNGESGWPEMDALNTCKPDPADGFPGGHALLVKDMIEAIRQDREPAIPGLEARKSLEIILAVYESARSGKEVCLPLAARG